MNELLSRLARIEPADLPVLSLYLDMRPHETGENPRLRSGLVVLKDRLREIEKTFLPRGEDLDSFHSDAVSIEWYLSEEYSPSGPGLAIFACAGRGLFEVVEAGVAFENQVSVGPTPDLFQLARLLDEQETSVVALVDSNTARLFVTRLGALEEVGGPDDDSVHYRKRSTGGWSQARYQRHIDKHRAEFAREAADEIADLVAKEDAVRVILAGDEVAITPLRSALSGQVAELVEDEVLRMDIRTPADDVANEITPVLARTEYDEARSAADRLVDEVRSGGLGVVGIEKTRRALEYGQVDELLLDPRLCPEEERAELVRLAIAMGGRVEVVEDHPALGQFGGVGALLRYRHPSPERVSS